MKNETFELFDNYLAGLLSNQEKTAFEDRLEADPNFKSQYFEFIQILDQINYSNSKLNLNIETMKDKEFQEIQKDVELNKLIDAILEEEKDPDSWMQKKIESISQQKEMEMSKIKGKKLWIRNFSIAASILVVITFGIFLFNNSSPGFLLISNDSENSTNKNLEALGFAENNLTELEINLVKLKGLVRKKSNNVKEMDNLTKSIYSHLGERGCSFLKEEFHGSSIENEVWGCFRRKKNYFLNIIIPYEIHRHKVTKENLPIWVKELLNYLKNREPGQVDESDIEIAKNLLESIN